MEYNRGTIKHLAGFFLTLALTFFVCLLLLYRTESLPEPYLPPTVEKFPAIGLRPPSTTGVVLEALANSKPQILWGG